MACDAPQLRLALCFSLGSTRHRNFLDLHSQPFGYLHSLVNVRQSPAGRGYVPALPRCHAAHLVTRADGGSHTSRYCRALREHPGCPPEIRLGIAACNFRLGSFQSAKAAYERTLQLNPDCCEALLGLAVLSFNAPDADRRVPCTVILTASHGHGLSLFRQSHGVVLVSCGPDTCRDAWAEDSARSRTRSC